MTLLATDLDLVATTVLGSGDPVTVFAHGLGGSSAETRVLAQRATGTRVLLDFRGHGDSAALPDAGWDYDLLAQDLLAVADEHGATRAVGLSLGAGALVRLLADRPDRFERLVFVLPAALDAARADGAALRLADLGAAIDAADTEEVARLMLAELPADVRRLRGAQLLLARRAERLVQRPAPVPAGDDRPLRDRRQLAAVDAPALVVGQRDDPLHPLSLAAELADCLPHGRLLALPPGGVFWTAVRDVQDAVAAHLTEDLA